MVSTTLLDSATSSLAAQAAGNESPEPDLNPKTLNPFATSLQRLYRERLAAIVNPVATGLLRLRQDEHLTTINRKP